MSVQSETWREYWVECDWCNEPLKRERSREVALRHADNRGWQNLGQDRFCCPDCQKLTNDSRICRLSHDYALNEVEIADLLGADQPARDRLVRERPYLANAIEDAKRLGLLPWEAILQ